MNIGGSKHKKAQAVLEYAIVIAVVVGVLLTMKAYLKRGFQGRLKAAVDPIGELYDPEQEQSSGKLEITSIKIEDETVTQDKVTRESNRFSTETRDVTIKSSSNSNVLSGL